MKRTQHRDRFNGRQSERRRHVRGNGGEPEHLDVKLFTGGLDGLQIRARIVPETKLQRMPHDRFPDLLAMSRKLVADRRTDEVRAVGIKAFLHQQIDVAEIDVTEVDCDLFGFARLQLDLEDLLGTKVDLAERAALRPRIRAHAEADMIRVF